MRINCVQIGANLQSKFLRGINSLRSLEDSLPEVIIIGAQKCATSSLFHYLSQHPNVSVSIIKEVHFFDYDENYKRGLNWYKKHFYPRKKGIVKLEGTGRYLYSPDAPQRLSEIDKKIMFLVILREPIERAFSAWNMYAQAVHNEKSLQKMKVHEINDSRIQFIKTFYSGTFPSFRKAVELELKWIKYGTNILEPSLLRRGFYVEQIKRWFSFFENDRFFFLDISSLGSEKINDTLDEIYEFIGVNKNNETMNLLIKKNVGSYSRELNISNRLREILNNLYKEKNDGLEELVGLKLNWKSL